MFGRCAETPARRVAARRAAPEKTKAKAAEQRHAELFPSPLCALCSRLVLFQVGVQAVAPAVLMVAYAALLIDRVRWVGGGGQCPRRYGCRSKEAQPTAYPCHPTSAALLPGRGVRRPRALGPPLVPLPRPRRVPRVVAVRRVGGGQRGDARPHPLRPAQELTSRDSRAVEYGYSGGQAGAVMCHAARAACHTTAAGAGARTPDPSHVWAASPRASAFAGVRRARLSGDQDSCCAPPQHCN